MDPATGVSRGCVCVSRAAADEPSHAPVPCSFGFVAFEHSASADALKSLRTIDFFGKTARAHAARPRAATHPLTRRALPCAPPAQRGRGAAQRRRRRHDGPQRARRCLRGGWLHSHAARAVPCALRYAPHAPDRAAAPPPNAPADVAACPAGSHGADNRMGYAPLDPLSYANFPPMGSASQPMGGHQHGGGYASGMPAAQEHQHHRRTEMQR